MTTTTPTTVGRPSRPRVLAGAGVILAGAAVLALLTLAGVAAPWLLLALGVTAVIAWLVDGTSTRYLGPGLVATAAGAGIVSGDALGMGVREAEHSLVYGGFGLALLAMSFLNPLAARAAGAFLLYTGLTVLFVGVEKGWWLVGILAVWGTYWLVRASRGDGLPRPALDGAAPSDRHEGARPLAGSRT